MSKTYSTIPKGGQHAAHLRDAIENFKDVPGDIGLFWKLNNGDPMAAGALNDVVDSLMCFLLSPPNKAELSEAIAHITAEPLRGEHQTFADMLIEQRRHTLETVYDPTVYNLDALACRGCGTARMGHCDISHSNGQHCTNCILWRQDSCVCSLDDARPLIEWLILEVMQARNDREKSTVLAQPKNFDNLAPNKKKQHTLEFCRKMFGASFVWPQGQPPSPAIPEEYCNNVLGLAGQQARDNVNARLQALKDKRQAGKAKYGSRDETDDRESAPGPSRAANSNKSNSRKTTAATSARATELAAKKPEFERAPPSLEQQMAQLRERGAQRDAHLAAKKPEFERAPLSLEPKETRWKARMAQRRAHLADNQPEFERAPLSIEEQTARLEKRAAQRDTHLGGKTELAPRGKSASGAPAKAPIQKEHLQTKAMQRDAQHAAGAPANRLRAGRRAGSHHDGQHC